MGQLALCILQFLEIVLLQMPLNDVNEIEKSLILRFTSSYLLNKCGASKHSFYEPASSEVEMTIGVKWNACLSADRCMKWIINLKASIYIEALKLLVLNSVIDLKEKQLNFYQTSFYVLNW